MERGRKRYTLGELVTISIFSILIAVTLITTYMLNHYVREYADIIQLNVEQRLLAESKGIADMISAEYFEELVMPEDMEKPIYRELTEKLSVYAKEHDLMYVYFMRLTNGKVQYIVDGDPNPETHYGLDYYEEPYPLLLEAFGGTTTYNLIGEYIEGWHGVLSAYMPIFDDRGDVIAVVGVDISDEDIVQRKNKSEILTGISAVGNVALACMSIVMIFLYRRKANSYNQASIAKSQFLSKMSHEIRTPMNAIIGYCRMARETSDPVKKEDYLENISSFSGYLLQLINDILDMSKIEAGKITLNLDKVSIREMVENVETIMMSQVRQKEQGFLVNISRDIPRYVYCDATYLTQVVVNLVSNAVKFTPRYGEISISVSLVKILGNRCKVEVAVKDSGVGIEEDKIKKLFEPFEQENARVTSKYGGTGLGLSISKHLVEMMNGEFSVKSKVNEGSTFGFYVWLDIVPKEEEPRNEDFLEDNGETLDCTGMTFLVVEDVDVNQIIVQNLLERFGMTIEFADNGREGLRMFIENPDKYSIILMDVQMPVMNGLEATRRIRESHVKNAKTIPIVAMTADVFHENVNEMMEVGMNAHIGKPLEPQEVLRVLKAILEI